MNGLLAKIYTTMRIKVIESGLPRASRISWANYWFNDFTDAGSSKTIQNGRYFGNYVVGRFSHFPNGRVDPSLAIKELIDQPVGRSLAALVDEISSELVELSPKDQT